VWIEAADEEMKNKISQALREKEKILESKNTFALRTEIHLIYFNASVLYSC